MRIETGHVAVITGGASGIGLGLSEALAARGVRLVMADIDDAKLIEAARGIDADDRPVTVRCDVGDAEAVTALRDAALDAFGRVDFVFNNAGVVLPFKPMWEHPLQDWRRLLDVNLWGVIHGIHTFAPLLVEQGTGHIINTASMAGVAIVPFNSVYNAAKHAVVSLTETLAAEFAARAPGVHASVICPGLVRTAILGSAAAQPADRPSLTQSDVAPGAELGMIEPSLLAQRTLAAIEADRTYIFTNPGSRDGVESRSAAIRADMMDW